MAENLSLVTFNKDQKVIYPVSNPITPTGGVVGLKGSLAPDGAIVKVAGMANLKFSGPARCFDCEEDAFACVQARGYKDGEVFVIRYEGPKGGPGMREMLSPTGAIMGKGMGKDVALITDGRFSGGSHGFVVGHITPEAFVGGPLAIVRNGDPISIDAEKRALSLNLPAKEITARLKKWKQPKPRYTRGVLAKYAKLVNSAHLGAVTDEGL